MSQRKKLIIGIISAAIVLVCIFAVSLLVQGDKTGEPPLEQVLEEKLTAYETDLRDSLGSLDTNDDVAEYLLNWAKNKEISASKDFAGNVIYTLPAAEHVQDAQPAALLCSFDADSMDRYVNEIAVGLTAAKNIRNNGPLKIIFLAEEDGEKTGIQGLNMQILQENTAVFCLGSTGSDTISTVTGGYQKISISTELTRIEPEYNKAFKITLKNCPEERISSGRDAVINPVKTLGSVLAGFKSTSLLFELSEFEGGSDADLSPSMATMTIVINDGDSAKFERKMTSYINKAYEKYKDSCPELEYTYEEADLPSTVISKDNTDNLVSLMYTIFNGVYNRDETGTITALTNIGKISTDKSRLRIDIAVMCSDETMLQDISDEYETICGLCDVNFKVKEQHPVYDGNTLPATAELYSSFEEAFRSFTGEETIPTANTAILTNCTFIQQANSQLPLLFCSVTEGNKHALAGTFVTWMDQGIAEESAT